MVANWWMFFFDWDNDGVAEINEADRIFHFEMRRGRPRMINNSGTGIERQQIGKATIKAWNDDRYFDPFYSSSPIYGQIAPGLRVECRVSVGATPDSILKEDGDKLLLETGDEIIFEDDDHYWRFTGTIDDIIPGMSGGRRIVTIKLVDGWRLLRDTPVSIDLMTDTNTNAALEAILDEVGWSDDASLRYVLGDGDDIDYFWTEGGSAEDEIYKLVESNLGQVYISGQGAFVFISRASLYNAAAGVEIDEDELTKNIETPYSWQQIRNIVRVKAHPTVEQTAIELWRLNDIPLVPAGETRELWADLTYEDRPVVVSSLTTPVATTDYTMNTQADGGGSNLTSDFTITATTLGRRIKLEVENGSAFGGYITLLKLRGNAIDVPNITQVESESSTVYPTAILDMDLLWQQSTVIARDLAKWLVSWLDEPLLFPIVEIDDQYTYTFDEGELFNRLELDLDTLEITNTDFYVTHIEERWLNANGQHVGARWMFEPADMTQYWVFTTSLGETSRFGY